MARCGNCGKANRDGALFCQDCGSSIEGRAPGVVGDAGDVRHGARVNCVKCGQPTPSGFSFCQHCGTRIPTSSEVFPRQGPPTRPGTVDLPIADIRPPLAPTPAPVARPVVSGVSGVSGTAGAHSENSPEPVRSPRPNGTLRGRLIILRRDGSDGEAIALNGETFDIGRSDGSRCFTDDVYMANRHVRFLAYAGGVRVRPIDNVNGVFLQLREPFELQSGDMFYIGRELLRFEMLHSEERDPAPLFEHGVRLFGTTPRESWGRLRQITTTGNTRDLWHLSRIEVRIGREEGDIVFPDDEFMSRRHAVLSRHGQRVRLEDQHSSNGTYVRLRGDRDLQPSDVLRVGDQVLRFEP